MFYAFHPFSESFNLSLNNLFLPIGKLCFRLSRYFLWPFGKFVLKVGFGIFFKLLSFIVSGIYLYINLVFVTNYHCIQ